MQAHRSELATALDEEERLLGRAVGVGRWVERRDELEGVELAQAWAALVRRHACGSADPAMATADWHLPRARCPTAAHSEALLFEAGSPRTALERLDDERLGLAAAMRALRELSELVASGGWPAVGEGALLERGVRDPRVDRLRRRLALSGDLAEARASDERFDAEVHQAVLRFQRRHGLLDDGRVGRRTLAALDRPAAERLAELRLNVERLRALPLPLVGEQLLVNVPGQELTGWEGGRLGLRQRVVVGTRRHRTPLFRELLTLVVFHPPWNVPGTLAARELLPQLRRDPESFRSKGYEILDRHERIVPLDELVLSGSESGGWSGTAAAARRPELGADALRRGDYRIRQQPGAANALGLVKFLFPNPYNVYLHDTNSTALFEEPSRAYSHGCIRVEDPVGLAAFVLRENRPAWDADSIRAAMRSPTREVRVERPLRVTITYLTAWVDPASGELQFRDDLYGHDAAWAAALVAAR